VFCEKSAQSIENKGREVEKERQESSRVRKGLEGKGIEEVGEVREFRIRRLLGRGAGETMVWRVFTSYDRADYRSCQYLYWVLIFTDWAQTARCAGVERTGAESREKNVADGGARSCLVSAAMIWGSHIIVNTHLSSGGEGPTIVQKMGNFARRFVESLGEFAVYLDSLPLEQKQPFKDFMITLGVMSGASSDSLKYLTREDKELERLLFGRCWWVLHKDITGPVKRDLLRLGREEKSDQIDAYLCAHFRLDDMARLRAKVGVWPEVAYLKERNQIISDCLEAHKDKKYSLTIPSLFPLIDGLTRHFRKMHLRPRRSKNPGGVMQVSPFVGYYRRKEHKLWGGSFDRFVRQIAYGHFEPGKVKPRNSLNRHGILHGEIPDYASEANSLKVFLMLDTIAQFVRAFEKRSRSNSSVLQQRKETTMRVSTVALTRT
jgi:hypothetical protein